MASEYVTFEDLVRFHKEVIAPDLDARFGRLEGRLEGKFGQIDARFEQINRRFEQVDQRFEQIDRRFEQIDRRFGEVDRRFELVAHEFNRLDDRITRLEERVDANHVETVGNFDRVFAYFASMATEYIALNGGLKRVEERLEKLEHARA